MTPVDDKQVALASHMNDACQCIWVDRDLLRSRLRAELGEQASVLDTRAGLVSGSVVFLGGREAAAMDRSVRLITRALESGALQAKVAAHAPEIAQLGRPPTSALLGFDFHLGGACPQLIEINTNPGGLLVNFQLAQAATASCDCLGTPISQLTSASPDLDRLVARVVASVTQAWGLARGDTPLRTIAIVDDDPTGQYLYPEFLLYQRLLERAGWRVRIADPAALTATADALLLGDERIDLVYNRLTDFYFAEERHAALRRAYASGVAVIMPGPSAHARYADKRLLAWLRDERLLAAAGLDHEEQAVVLGTIPPTEIVETDATADLWVRRKGLFFKPIDGFGGKAAYRGDKLTRTAFEHIMSHRYVAQAIVPTSSRRVSAAEGQEVDLRVDVRCFALRGETWLRCARLYRGQTTNFRTAGGGFAPVLTLPV